MKLYRYNRSYDDCRIYIDCTEFEVIRETKYCYVIDCSKWLNSTKKEKFILKCQCNKKFAHDNKKDALEYFIKRTKRFIKIQENQIHNSNMFLQMAINYKL